MQRWQYRVVNLGAFFTADRLVSTLGRLGSEGWEIVHVYDKASNWWQGLEKGFALFKRPVPADIPEPTDGWARIDAATNYPTGNSANVCSVCGARIRRAEQVACEHCGTALTDA